MPRGKRTYARDGRGRFAASGSSAGKMRRNPVKDLKKGMKDGLTAADARQSLQSYKRGVKTETKYKALDKRRQIAARRGSSVQDRQYAGKQALDNKLQLRDAKRQTRAIGRFVSRRGGTGR